MSDNELLVDALNRVHMSQAEMNVRLSKVLEDHETRIRSAEQIVQFIRTLGLIVAAALSFIGWGAMRGHLTIK